MFESKFTVAHPLLIYMSASVAIVYKNAILLTREKRGKVSKLGLPGGKAMLHENHGTTAAREAHEETGCQLSEKTLAAIVAIPIWTECRARASQHVGVLHLEDDTDATVHQRFDPAVANCNPCSKTVHEGLEWHPISNVHDPAWRKKNMHFHGDHLARVACTVI